MISDPRISLTNLKDLCERGGAKHLRLGSKTVNRYVGSKTTYTGNFDLN